MVGPSRGTGKGKGQDKGKGKGVGKGRLRGFLEHEPLPEAAGAGAAVRTH